MGVAALVCLLRIALNPWWGSSFPYLFFFPVTFVSAVIAGARPAILVVALTSVATALWLQPAMGWGSDAGRIQLTGLGSYIGVNLLLVWFGAEFRAILQEKERHQRELADRDERLARESSARQDTREALHDSLRTQRLLAVLGEFSTRFTAMGEFLETFAARVAEELGVSRCGFAWVDLDAGIITAEHDYHGQFDSIAGQLDLNRYGSHFREASLEGRTVAVADLSADPRTAAIYESTFAPVRVRSHINVPLIREGRWVANFWVCHHEARMWKEAELELMKIVADRLWASVQRRRAEEALRRSEQRFRLLAESLPQFVWETLGDGALAFVNQRWIDFSGLDLAATSDHVVRSEIYHPDEREAAAEAWTRARAELTTMQMEARLRRRDGEYRWCLIRAEPVIEDGRIVRWFGTSTDITEMKRTERALRESEQSFRALADAMPQLVWVADREGHVTYYNSRGSAYHGLQRLENGEWAWAPMVHPEDLGATLAAWSTAMREQTSYQAEHRLQMTDGTYRWHLSRAHPVSRDGELQWFGTATDIHEIKETQSALSLAKDQAEAANRAKDEFLAALSHELRTPLTPVLMGIALLREDTRLPEDALADLEMMHRNICLEARLIDDLLDLTRISRRKLPLSLKPCDVHTLLHEAVEIVRSGIREKELALQLRLEADRSQIEGDPVRLQQVFWNILRNAVKFTPLGGRILVATSRTDSALVVAISDTGLGFAPELAEKIFAPFDQGDLAREHRFGGLGLGLAIARAIVELHQGTIAGASSGPGAGATFTVTLPLQRNVEVAVLGDAPVAASLD